MFRGKEKIDRWISLIFHESHPIKDSPDEWHRLEYRQSKKNAEKLNEPNRVSSIFGRTYWS